MTMDTALAHTPTAEHIRAYIEGTFLSPEDAALLGDDDDLLEILDSLQVLRMVTELEERFALKFQNSDMTPENLGSINRLAAFIEAKR